MFRNVFIIVMKTTDKVKFDFVSKPQYSSNLYFSETERDIKDVENQQFVVPWQMVNTNKNKKILVD